MSARTHLTGRPWAALALAAAAGAAATALSSTAGWFLAAAAITGALGPAAANAFNFLFPSAAVRFFALSRTLTRYGERVVGHDAVLAASAALRPRLFRALAADARGVTTAGDIDARLMRDIEAVEADLVLVRAPQAAAVGAVAAAFAALLFTGWGAALGVALAFVVAGVAAPRLARRWTAQSGPAIVAARADLRVLGASLGAALAEIKAGGMEAQALAAFEAAAGAIAARERETGNAAAAAAMLAQLVATAALAALAWSLARPGADAAAGVAGVLAALALFDQVAPLTDAGARATERAAAVARLAALAPPEQGAPPAAPPSPPWDIAARDLVLMTREGVALGPPLSFRVAAGEIAVLVGRSGAGKTTLLRQLLGFAHDRGGELLVGDAPPGHRADGLFAYAPQTADLLPGSVRENLALAAPDAADAAMRAALRLAQIDDAVAAAGGLDASIDALGEGFSGGETRRLSLARAFVSGRPILLLDEPTEGLDAATERRVIDGVRQYVADDPRRLALIVTHRPALLALADTIIDLDLGAAVKS